MGDVGGDLSLAAMIISGFLTVNPCFITKVWYVMRCRSRGGPAGSQDRARIAAAGQGRGPAAEEG